MGGLFFVVLGVSVGLLLYLFDVLFIRSRACKIFDKD